MEKIEGKFIPVIMLYKAGYTSEHERERSKVGPNGMLVCNYFWFRTVSAEAMVPDSIRRCAAQPDAVCPDSVTRPHTYVRSDSPCLVPVRAQMCSRPYSSIKSIKKRPRKIMFEWILQEKKPYFRRH